MRIHLKDPLSDPLYITELELYRIEGFREELLYIKELELYHVEGFKEDSQLGPHYAEGR